MTPWFGPKEKYEFGIASWQGVAALLLFLAGLYGLQHFFRPAQFGLPVWSRLLLTLAWAAAFLALSWAKYDRAPDA